MKADANTLGYVGTKPGMKVAYERDSNSWFTPIKYTDMVREVMGEIDLDPFSAKSANSNVKALRYFDINDDAHEQAWFDTKGRVFMNPPYGRGEMARAVNTFMDNYSKGRVSEAVILVNNATETKWFQDLLVASAAVFLPSSRIAFENDDGKNISGNTRGQVFIYFGDDATLFHEVFQRIGITLESHSSLNDKVA